MNYQSIDFKERIRLEISALKDNIRMFMRLYFSGEPFGFEDYFIINSRYGHVNKTREVIEGDPHSFMMIIQVKKCVM